MMSLIALTWSAEGAVYSALAQERKQTMPMESLAMMEQFPGLMWKNCGCFALLKVILDGDNDE